MSVLGRYACPGLLLTTLAALALAGSALAAQGGSVTTTIYVGQHFEVRDHDQPTKYVFNGATRVAEVTGSLSGNLRVQRFRLLPGWNLCSLAVTGPFPASGAEAISAAYQWNPGTHDYSQVALGQTMTAGTVLWVKARTNAVVSVLGVYGEPVPRQLQAGGAYVPATGLEAWSPALPDSASSWDFDASIAQWSDHLEGDLAVVSGPPPILSPGQAFYAIAAAPANLQIPDPALRIRYYHEDHLGSSSVVSDSNGAMVEETAYYPFGIPRNEFQLRHLEEPYDFTQKERDLESGLHYFETRFLAGTLARFVTPDLKHACPDRLLPQALGDRLSSPQQLNLYAYVQNNPLRYIDPLGEDSSKPKEQPDPAEEQAPITLTLISNGGEMNIAVSTVGWRLANQIPIGETGGSVEVHKQVFQELALSRRPDQWSTKLMQMAAVGQEAGGMSGEIVFRRTVEGHSEVYMRIKLKDVVISSYGHSGGPNSGLPPTEAVTLSTTEFKIERPGQQPTGELPALKGWSEQNVLRNRYSKPESPSAPPAAPAGGNDLNPFHLMKKLFLNSPD